MAYPYQGPYPYDLNTVRNWNSDAIGIYYCGAVLPNGNLIPYYIGRAIAEGGIRNRLLQHLGESKWRDVTHFGYVQCLSAQEATAFEVIEITTYKPKYNTHHN